MKTCPKMQAVVESLTARHDVNLEMIGARLRLDMPGFDRLCIERLTPMAVSVAHYFEVNGDLTPEPDIVFYTADTAGWIPIEIAQSLTGWLQLVQGGFTSPLQTGTQKQVLDEVADFAELWADNLVAQGWLEKGVKHVYRDYYHFEDIAF